MLNQKNTTDRAERLRARNKPKLGWRVGAIIVIALLALCLGGVILILRGVNSFFDDHYLKFNKAVQVALQWPVVVEERKVEMAEVVEAVETIPHPEDLETDIEKYIYEVFGIENYRVAIAIARAESQMNCNAVGINPDSVDLGLFQVNSSWLKNYSLEELANCERNVEVAYDIWDRGDGEEGNGRGSWNPWTVARNGAMLKFLE